MMINAPLAVYSVHSGYLGDPVSKVAEGLIFCNITYYNCTRSCCIFVVGWGL